jgi:hypothetical protein
MFEYLEQLRKKPLSVRKRIAFFVALSFAGFIFVIWLSIIFPDFRKNEALQANVLSSEPSPITTLGSQIDDGVSEIGSKISDLKNALSSFTDPTYIRANTESTTTITSENSI